MDEEGLEQVHKQRPIHGLSCLPLLAAPIQELSHTCILVGQILDSFCINLFHVNL